MSKGAEGMSGARSSCSSNHSYIASSAAFRAEARQTGEGCKLRDNAGQSSAKPIYAPAFDLSDCFAMNIEFEATADKEFKSRKDLLEEKKNLKGLKSQFA